MEPATWIFLLLLLTSSAVLADEAATTVTTADQPESGASAPQAEEVAETGESPPRHQPIRCCDLPKITPGSATPRNAAICLTRSNISPYERMNQTGI